MNTHNLPLDQTKTQQRPDETHNPKRNRVGGVKAIIYIVDAIGKTHQPCGNLKKTLNFFISVQ
ncbi:hypothetical protein [Acinetobacter defluvii]|uniref:hypothetical protein n=1 Tax=Acinetobacter defluvii TaxID=1871111 RepID=UPI003AF80A25